MIIWNENTLRQKLDYRFLNKVKEKMRADETAVVQFGIKGDGIYPNYQIRHSKFPNHPRAFRGRNHERFELVDSNEFTSSNLSEEFSYSIISKLVDELY